MMIVAERAHSRRGRRVRRGVIAALAIGVVGTVGVATIANAVDRPVRTKLSSARCGAPTTGRVTSAAGQTMTPYPVGVRTNQFFQGTTLQVSESDLDTGVVSMRLRLMRDSYHINTVSVYGMEGWDARGGTARKDRFFAALQRLGMRVVVRIEGYDQRRFAFATADVSRMLDTYQPLIRYVADPTRRGMVAYLGLNMPVDDPAVQARLGGLGSARFNSGQPGYAAGAVSAIRGVLADVGAGNVAVYVGVFYGWDDTYRPPSYRSARADGYFLNSYSYPTSGLAAVNASDAALINEPRLRETMRLFTTQYGTEVPVIVEYGFHTAEYHGNGALPNQTAGLVANAAAKRRALVATTRFYCASYASVRGTMYFGYNIFKAEGNPPAVLDFALSKNP
jgi:hypothetical protein